MSRIRYSPIGHRTGLFAGFLRLGLGAAAAIGLGLAGCSRPEADLEKSFTVMDTVVSVKIPPGGYEQMALAYHLTKDVLEQIGHLTDPRNFNSELSQINRTAGSARIPASRDMIRLLTMALDFSASTGGALDITTASLGRLWGCQGNPVPDDPLSTELTRAAMGGVGRRHVKLLDQGSIEFTSPYTRITLEGLSDGYAVDTSIVQSRRTGIHNVLINMGGRSIRCLGNSGRQGAWTIPLQNPFFTEEQIGTIALSDGLALATTRLYDNFVTIRGKRYGCIIDPRTGQPAEGTASASVVAPTAIEANALSIALIVLGTEECRRIFNNFPECHALIIPDREPAELWLTLGMTNYFAATPSYLPAVKQIPPVE